MAKYFLYGSNVLRIQSLIFETGKLKEIIGASELVEQICTDRFLDLIGSGYREANLILGAAGKIIYIFDDRGACEKVVRHFHKNICADAPGIQLVQAVVEVEGEFSVGHLRELERRLDIQRNRAVAPSGLALMISERSRRTGGAGVWHDGEIMDRKQQVKHILTRSNRESLFNKMLGDNHSFPASAFPRGDMSELVKDEKSGWLAVVHADGNGLGKMIQKIGTEVSKHHPGKLHHILKAFSSALDAATRAAAREAFELVVQPVYEKEKKVIPLRPVLLGGDDITIVIRGDLAVPFTSIFLERFGLYTQLKLISLSKEYRLPILAEGLSACAGIAFIKSKFPFHYGVSLADSLCHYAKKTAKSISAASAPSCLAFHRVQSSFVENYDRIIEQELTAGVDDAKVHFNYGPYFVKAQPGFSTIADLQNRVKAVNKADAPKAGLRNWLVELHGNHAGADQLMERIRRLHPKYISRLQLDVPIKERQTPHKLERVTPIYDILALSAIEK